MDKELVAEWLKHADDDIDTALLLKEMRPQHYEIICYHCEQAVEKYLKGYLVSIADVEKANKFALEVKSFVTIEKLRDDIDSA